MHSWLAVLADQCLQTLTPSYTCTCALRWHEVWQPGQPRRFCPAATVPCMPSTVASVLHLKKFLTKVQGRHAGDCNSDQFCACNGLIEGNWSRRRQREVLLRMRTGDRRMKCALVPRSKGIVRRHVPSKTAGQCYYLNRGLPAWQADCHTPTCIQGCTTGHCALSVHPFTWMA